jgi:hypothetical protein
MMRHTVLFMFRDSATEADRLVAVKGLAYLAFGCHSVRALDFGRDLFGGSSRLLANKPWERTPVWHARESGPPWGNYDMALHVDFDDAAGFEAYLHCPAHREVSDYNEKVVWDEYTARVDWHLQGTPRTDRGGVRHTSCFLWDDGIGDAAKDEAREALASLGRSVPTVRSAVVGDNARAVPTAFNLVLDVLFDDVQGARAYFAHPAQKEAAALLAGVTKHEWTARITHTVRSG